MKEIKRWIQKQATRFVKNKKCELRSIGVLEIQKDSKQIIYLKRRLLGMFSSFQQRHGWLYHC